MKGMTTEEFDKKFDMKTEEGRKAWDRYKKDNGMTG
jgi:hypothetical protein